MNIEKLSELLSLEDLKSLSPETKEFIIRSKDKDFLKRFNQSLNYANDILKNYEHS
nr:MAG: hypothetical protein [Caudoviricetes sp.]